MRTPDPCAALRPLLWSLADGSATPGERAEAEAHLAACPACRETLAEARATLEALRTLAPAPPGGAGAEELTARIMARLRAGEGSAGTPPERSPWIRALRTRMFRPQYQAAALVIVCLAGVWVTWSARHAGLDASRERSAASRRSGEEETDRAKHAGKPEPENASKLAQEAPAPTPAPSAPAPAPSAGWAHGLDRAPRHEAEKKAALPPSPANPARASKAKRAEAPAFSPGITMGFAPPPQDSRAPERPAPSPAGYATLPAPSAGTAAGPSAPTRQRKAEAPVAARAEEADKSWDALDEAPLPLRFHPKDPDSDPEPALRAALRETGARLLPGAANRCLRFRLQGERLPELRRRLAGQGTLSGGERAGEGPVLFSVCF